MTSTIKNTVVPSAEKIDFLSDYMIYVKIELKYANEVKYSDRDDQWFREDMRKKGMLHVLNMLFDEEKEIDFLRDFMRFVEVDLECANEVKWTDRDEQWFREDMRKQGMLHILRILFEEEPND
jgi:hypothetical protein